MGNRRLVEKHKPTNSRQGKICKIVDKKMKECHNFRKVEFPDAQFCIVVSI